jgi:hypothetical protein
VEALCSWKSERKQAKRRKARQKEVCDKGTVNRMKYKIISRVRNAGTSSADTSLKASQYTATRPVHFIVPLYVLRSGVFMV